jgi:hypothetical protein
MIVAEGDNAVIADLQARAAFAHAAKGLDMMRYDPG